MKKSFRVSRVFTVLAVLSALTTVVSTFMLYVRTFNAPRLAPGVECGSMPTLAYVGYGGLAGMLVFGLLAFFVIWPSAANHDSV